MTNAPVGRVKIHRNHMHIQIDNIFKEKGHEQKGISIKAIGR